MRTIPSYGGPLIAHITHKRVWLGERSVLAREHVGSFRDGGVAALPIHVDSFDDICTLMSDVIESRDSLRICRTRGEIDVANREGAVALLLAPGFTAVGERLDRLYVLKALGAVMFPMSLNNRNMLADGCGERGASGLSHLGVQAVRLLNSLGIIIDVSHLSDKAFWDTIEVSDQPVIASHSDSRALCDNPRNLTDEQVRAIAERGGTVGVSVHPSLLSRNSPTVETYIDHILHYLDVAGEDHVTMGADFIDYQIELMLPKLRPSAKLGIYHEGQVTVPGLSGFSDLAGVVERLRARGPGDGTIEKISAGNFLRVMDAVVG